MFSWSDFVNIIDSKFLIWELRLKIILSFKTTLCSNKYILPRVKFNSFLTPSPIIKSLITNFTIGLFN